MGQLQGKATYLKATTPFLNASERDVNKLWEGFNDVAEGFGLNQDEMVEICRSMQSTLEIHARNEMDQLSAGLFTALDTDENGLVDALEFLGTMAMMSAMPIPQKLTFVYNCYDFNETGQLSLDELTLALKSTLTGLCKLCVAVSCPTELVLEDLAQHAFQRSQKSGVNDFLTLPEFLRFSETTPEMTSWVDYFDCPDEIVDEQDGDDSDAEREAAASFLAPSAQDDESTARKRDVGLPQDSAAPDLSNNKVLPRRPWQLAVGNTAPSAPPKVDPRMPSASLELEWIYGYNSDVRAAVTALFPFAGGLLSGGKDGKVRVWSRRLEPGAQFDLVALGSFAPRVRSLVASPDGGAKLLIATAGAEIYEIASSDGANLHFGSVVCGHASFQLHDLSTHPNHCAKLHVVLPALYQPCGLLLMGPTSWLLRVTNDAFFSGVLNEKRSMWMER
ncbi:hypothetical protein PHYBOEH_006957 [Phytophthora boehmeriae]|uniref:EF-hand domain-containing protein n=1 Tax=Phytophthora boehmeriae TaxID=109152 RepID=A0A8T1WAI3_9STRA|nr:hypothetical protein PHYBOEH_006957 [Phytophthora boehmeriae]